MRRPRREMERLRRKCLDLLQCNPTLSIERVAKHFGVSVPTLSKWIEEANLKKWHT